MQLQPAVVVGRAAYLRLYPEDTITAPWVVINGCRRLAAARKYGRADLEIVVKDEIARDRATLVTAAISENIDRVDFDVIEEARAVEALVAECGRADEAARRLRKTEGWVSQRRALLKLAPELQAALRAGELAVRVARSLARVPLEQQVAAWQAALDKEAAAREDSPDGRPDARDNGQPRTATVTKALRQFDSRPHLLAEALRTYLGDDGVKTLMVTLENLTRTVEPGIALG
ncbi:MAG: peptide transporter [Mycolicibacterium sp.]|nr:peptide transporter [Mycolicibacterium sp.]